jgi:hypothetical protein
MQLHKPVSLLALFFAMTFSFSTFAQKTDSVFKVLGFYTGKSDLAHISFVREANFWFNQMAKQHHFVYDSTNDWGKLNRDTLSSYKVILFLDTRPEDPQQRKAFEQYMRHGGGWIGFHFAGFALTPSSYPQNWDWYHDQFLGSGQYRGNTWRPTAAILRNEDSTHPATTNLPVLFTSAPNEWYSWENDLRKNADIDILLSIDSASFPLGTGPKQHEIWHSGYYPVVWTNKKYNMLYINMGHNDMDYEGGTNQPLSSSFTNDLQNKMLLNGLLWIGGRKKPM